jgi:hypothetical protein
MVLLSAVKLFENQSNRLHLFKTGTEMDCAALVCRSATIFLRCTLKTFFSTPSIILRFCILRLKTYTLGEINDHQIFVLNFANRFEKTRNFMRISNLLKIRKKGTHKKLFAENLAKQS